MRVRLLGSGAREHALVWKLSQNKDAELFCAPGNPGTARQAENVSVAIEQPAEVAKLAKAISAKLVVVGPEAPLVRGTADALMDAGIPVFGPVAAAAAIEGSKAFAKQVMERARVPTASYRLFDSPTAAEEFVRSGGAAVIKADGLAAGKGVVVARNGGEAVQGIRSLAKLGRAAHTLLVEERLEGEEVSVIALCDGERFALLPPAQDHKRLLDGDLGPNTGGMGACCPALVLDEEALDRVGEEIILPTLSELRRRGCPFRGALYAGLMVTRSGPKVLEFNCRFGDPEAQVLMMQIDEDLLALLIECASGSLARSRLRLRPGASVGVVIAAQDYPQTPRRGDEISGLAEAETSAQVFHGGTRRDGNRLVTAGGRVLTVCSWGENVREARSKAYAAAALIRFRGMHYRRDIGSRALAAPKANASAIEKGG